MKTFSFKIKRFSKNLFLSAFETISIDKVVYKVSNNLVIVESPSKAKTIKKYLGSGYDVVASMGHVRDLPENRLSVDVKHDFKPRYAVIKGKEKLADSS